jgi:hypothetical protein
MRRAPIRTRHRAGEFRDRYGSRLCSLLRAQGVTDVRVEAHAPVCAGGSLGCPLYRSNIEQLQSRFADVGRTTDSGSSASIS